MDRRARLLAARASALLVGLGLAFFFVLAPLFTDGPPSLADAERLASLALTLGVYLACGILIGFVAPRDMVTAGMLAAPGLVLAAFYATSETNVLGLAAVYVALAFVGAVAGVRIAGMRRDKSPGG
jgi:hypothetical protein